MEDLVENRKQFSELLGLEELVSEEVFFSAVRDDSYAHNLILCKDQPEFLDHLLSSPPKQVSEIEQVEGVSNSKLMLNAAQALGRWAKTGFSVVDKEVLKTREEACLSCSNLNDPSNSLQGLLPTEKVNGEIGSRTGRSTCKLCGCNVGRKMRLTSESCPDKHQKKNGYTKWNEPIRS